MVDYFLSKKEAREHLKNFGVPYATERLLQRFFSVEEKDNGHLGYYPRFSDEKIREIIGETNLLSYVKRFGQTKDQSLKESIRREAYGKLDSYISQLHHKHG